MIGLVGAHRTGKTTLARTYAEKTGALYLDASVTKIIREAGYDPAAAGKYDFKTRLDVQEIVLKKCCEIYASATPGLAAITDRTPLDMLGYTMSEAIGNVVGEAEQARFAVYVQDCFDATNRYFSTVLLLQPGIPLKDADGKAVANEAFIEHLNSLMFGLTVDPRLKVAHYYVPRHLLSIPDRLAAISHATGRTVDIAMQAVSQTRELGGHVH